ncbi:putative ABC transport system ATP-binding protein [Chitinophaga skermanii]|uniref:Putative ABC transport system ATP-binding protein n=1 Tax=Chitinophaga skermanii TaxID=331697 RepID=A0A327Q2T1_9BACT|nr:ATP-binding cassette domain-containing protein [Chitinophaga skermanii]RAI98720.1 putative ABC transport system ATP-binding protein [Chitinophaga skermanii]
MQISLHQLVPIPLKEKVLQQTSGIWNQAVTFTPGQWVKIKAPSGTGKTTLIHYLYNTRYDYTGDIHIDQKPWPAYNPTELANIRQSQVSVIFQDLRLFDQLTALENIELKNIMQGQAYYSREKIEDMAAQLQVTHILQQSAATLSYGERQRIAIIRALVQPFSWLMMDEPFSHLDENNTRRAAKLIAEECTARKAGFILTDLDDDTHFPYTAHYQL